MHHDQHIRQVFLVTQTKKEELHKIGRGIENFSKEGRQRRNQELRERLTEQGIPFFEKKLNVFNLPSHLACWYF